MKRTISLIILISVLTTFFAVSLPTIAADDIGDNINWHLDSKGCLTISGTGAMKEFDSTSSYPWHSQRSSIKSIVIANGVTNIGRYAFDSCSKLTSVSFSASVIDIGDYAFSNCKTLFDLSLPSNIESIGDHAFEKCPSIKSLIVPASVKYLGEYAFNACTSLRDLTIYSGVESISSYAFADCKTIASLSLPKSVTNVCSHAFEGCEGLTKLTIPSTVLSLGDYAFNNCKTLVTIRIYDSLQSIGIDAFKNTAFYNNSSNWENGLLYLRNKLIALNPSFYGDIELKEGTEYIAGAVFANRDNVGKVTVPDSVQLIENNSFENCSAVIRCKEGSYAATYALNNNVRYEYIIVLPEPVFSPNGLQLKVSGLEGVAVIRTAYGSYENESQIKRGNDARAFSSKSVLRDKNEYYIQYRKEGSVTVSVRYLDGHIVYYNYNVVKKTPKLTKDENTVTFTDVDDFLVIRYAKGEYSSSYDIKRAPDCRNISWKSYPLASRISIDIDENTYTFCVQYKDESYNYYTVRVDTSLPRIFCWGDSLTMGIETGWDDIVDVPYPERLEEYTGYETYNCGVGSDYSDQIAMRQGAVKVYAKNIVIPSDRTRVAITPYLEDGTIAQAFCYNGFAGINDVEIAGVKGRLTDVNGSVSEHDNLRIYFTRNEPGEEVVVKEPTEIRTNSALTARKDDILVLWIGSNDLNDAEDTSYFEYIVDYQEQMIESVGTDKYVIVGYTADTYLGVDGYTECADEYNALMKEYWGEHFVDIKEYMATYQALEDFGIEPTDEDRYRLARGWIPLSFLEGRRWNASNAIHFNQIGYDCVEYLIELKLYELGYIEKL